MGPDMNSEEILRERPRGDSRKERLIWESDWSARISNWFLWRQFAQLTRLWDGKIIGGRPLYTNARFTVSLFIGKTKHSFLYTVIEKHYP